MQSLLYRPFCNRTPPWSLILNKPQYEAILRELKMLGNPAAVEGMARYGINSRTAHGVSIPKLRKIASAHRSKPVLAGMLWESGIHEARILASMIDDPQKVTADQMDRWARDFNSWDVCDQCCNNLFRKVIVADRKAREWASRPEEFVKRAGFVLMACQAVHDKHASDERFVELLSIIVRESADKRNLVKKAVNWALRQIGKRNMNLNRAAIDCAREIAQSGSKAAKWIAADALRELTSDPVQKRLEGKDAGKGLSA
jgi:3-methyladenine DNA glycosylase AlkD